jgi:hypothetical protein
MKEPNRDGSTGEQVPFPAENEENEEDEHQELIDIVAHLGRACDARDQGGGGRASYSAGNDQAASVRRMRSRSRSCSLPPVHEHMSTHGTPPQVTASYKLKVDALLAVLKLEDLHQRPT